MKIDIPTEQITDYAVNIANKQIRLNVKNKIEGEIRVIADFQNYVDRYYELAKRVTALEERLNKKRGLFRK